MSKKFLALAGIAVTIVLTAFMAMPRGTEAHIWSPFFGPSDFYRLEPTTISANASPGVGTYPDIHAQYNVFAPSPNFTPLFGGAMTLGDADVATATAAGIPNTGAIVGSLTAGSILGIAGEGCNTLVPVTFRFVEGSVDHTQARPLGAASPPSLMTTSAAIAAGADNLTYAGADYLGTKTGALTTGTPGDANHPDAAVNEIRIDAEDMLVTGVNAVTNTLTVLRGWNGSAAVAHNTVGTSINRVNVIYENGPPANQLANLAEDDGDIDNNGTVDHPNLVNNIADGADEVPAFVRNSQDPDGNPANGGAVASYARYVGNAPVQGLIVILQFSILSPGVLNTGNFPNLQWVTSDWGYQSVTYLQDPVAPPSNSAITDFCNFSSNTFFYGIPHDNACTAAVEPAACNLPQGGFILQDAKEPCPPANPNCDTPVIPFPC